MTLAISRGETASAVPYSGIARAILDSVDRFPEGQFVHAKRNGVLSTTSYRQMLQNARCLAGALQRRGLKAGDGLIINLRNSDNFIPALWAALFVGLVAVPLVQNAGKHLGAPRRKEIFSFLGLEIGRAHV